MKVLLVPNYSRPDAVEASSKITEWLQAEGCEVTWAHDKRRDASRHTTAEGCDLVVSLGGDGTLLRAARIVGYAETPILGLSFGHLGFLTGAGSEDVVGSVSRALAGDLHVSRRATLDVELDLGEERIHHFALNELALTRGGEGDMIEFDLSVSGIHIDRLRGDGFVVATATGSTGYALASGGPIVHPDFKGMVCVPIAPHTIQARAFLAAPSDVVELEMVAERPAARIAFVDGQVARRDAFVERVTVRRGPGDVVLLDAGPSNFYRSVSRVFYGQVGK